MPTCRNRLAMPNVRASSATMGTIRGPSVLSFRRLLKSRTAAMVVDISLLGPKSEFGVSLERRHRYTLSAPAPRGQITTKGIAPRAKIAKLGAVFGGLVEFERGGLFVGERKGEAVAESDERVDIELLGLMRGHAGFGRSPHAVTFLGLGEDNGWLILGRSRGFEGGEELAKIVAATLKPVDLAIRHMRDKVVHLRVFVKEVKEVVAAVSGAERLVLAIDRGGEPPKQRMLLIAREESVPFRAPEDLDDVPARAPEQALQFRNDLPVAAHRPIETLEIAVDDEGQIVEPFARRERKARDRFRLIHLAVAENAPDMSRRCIGETTMLEIAKKTSLVDRGDRTDAHRTSRRLPEIGHEPGMGIGTQTPAADLLAVPLNLLFRQPAFEKSARIDAWRRMGLEENKVALVSA